MKRMKNKGFVATWLIVLILLSIYLLSDFTKNNLEKNLSSKPIKCIIKEETIDVSNINTIEVDCFLENVNINFSNDNSVSEMKIIEKSQKKVDEALQYSTRTKEDKISIMGIDETVEIDNNILELSIILPEKLNNDLILNAQNGDIRITGSGHLKTLLLKQEYGNLYSEGTVNTETLEVNNILGNCELNMLYTKKYNIVQDSGNLIINNLVGAGNISNVNGTIKLGYMDMLDSSSINCSTNDIEVQLASTFKGLIKLDSRFGKISSNLELDNSDESNTGKTVKIGENADYILNINDTSGNIQINA